MSRLFNYTYQTLVKHYMQYTFITGFFLFHCSLPHPHISLICLLFAPLLQFPLKKTQFGTFLYCNKNNLVFLPVDGIEAE